MGLGTAELTPIVGQDRIHRHLSLFIERQHVVVQDGHRRIGLLGGVQEAKGMAAVGIHRGAQVHLALAFEVAHKEGILGQELAGTAAL